MEPAFSIILATYKQAGQLKKILYALEEQTYKHFEVIICDDGSVDYEVLKDGWSFPLRYVWQQDEGFRAAASKNNGINLAKHDYIVYLEADVVPTKGWLEAYAKAANERSVLIGIRHTSNDIGDPENTVRFQDERIDKLLVPVIKDYANPWRLLSGCNCVWPKAGLIEVGMNDESFVGHGWDDWHLAARMFQAGYRMTPVMDAVAYHIWHGYSESPSENKDKCIALEKQIIAERIAKGEINAFWDLNKLEECVENPKE